jgi:hypothetical protein
MADEEKMVIGAHRHLDWIFDLDRELLDQAIKYHSSMMKGMPPVMVPMPRELMVHAQRLLDTQGGDLDLPVFVAEALALLMSVVTVQLVERAQEQGNVGLADRIKARMRRRIEAAENGGEILLS